MLALFALSALAGPHTALLTHDADPRALEATLRSEGARTARCWSVARVCVAEFDDVPALAALATLPGVRTAERDAEITRQLEDYADADGTPSCPGLWDLETLGALDAWELATGVGAEPVAVVDGGFLTTHVDLADGVIADGWNYALGNSDISVSWAVGVPAHGTFISGLIAANPFNNRGRAGIMPEGTVYAAKTADADGNLFYSYTIAALAEIGAGDGGVRVVSYSLTGPNAPEAQREAVRALGDADILMVAAAGNCPSPNCGNANNDDFPTFPASYGFPHLLSVAGTDRGDGFNPTSHYGPTSVHLAAPGTQVCSLGVQDDNDTYSSSGTSYAAPLVAGVAGLVRERHPDLTAPEIAQILIASSVPAAALDGKVVSNGVVHAGNAVRAGFPRLEAPADLAVAEAAAWAIPLDNVGYDTEATLVLLHDPIVSFEGPGGWQAISFGVGEAVDLPDGPWSATAPGTLLVGPLAEHATGPVEVAVTGVELGTTDVTVRVITTSSGGTTIPAPALGDADASGAPAFAATITVTEVAREGGKACGCTTSGAAGLAPWLLGLIVLVRRRR